MTALYYGISGIKNNQQEEQQPQQPPSKQKQVHRINQAIAKARKFCSLRTPEDLKLNTGFISEQSTEHKCEILIYNHNREMIQRTCSFHPHYVLIIKGSDGFYGHCKSFGQFAGSPTCDYCGQCYMSDATLRRHHTQCVYRGYVLKKCKRAVTFRTFFIKGNTTKVFTNHLWWRLEKHGILTEEIYSEVFRQPPLLAILDTESGSIEGLELNELLLNIGDNSPLHNSIQAVHRCLAVSICSNIDGYRTPKVFISETAWGQCVSETAGYLIEMAETAGRIMTERFQPLFQKINLAFLTANPVFQKFLFNVKRELEKFCKTLPIIGYNSSRFDYPLLLGAGLFDLLDVADGPTAFIRKGLQLHSVATQRLKFVDLLSYISTRTSLNEFLKSVTADGNKEKIIFPYQKMTSLESLNFELKNLQIVDYENSLNGTNLLTRNLTRYDILCKKMSEEQALAILKMETKPGSGEEMLAEQKAYHEQMGLKTVRDLLRVYAENDVTHLVAAAEDMSKTFSDIFLLKIGCCFRLFSSLPSMSYQAAYFEAVTSPHFDHYHLDARLYELFSENIVGGISEQMCSLKEIGMPIKPFEFGGTAELTESIYSFDIKSSYIGPLLADYAIPLGVPIIREKERFFRPIYHSPEMSLKYLLHQFLRSEYPTSLIRSLFTQAGEMKLSVRQVPQISEYGYISVDYYVTMPADPRRRIIVEFLECSNRKGLDETTGFLCGNNRNHGACSLCRKHFESLNREEPPASVKARQLTMARLQLIREANSNHELYSIYSCEMLACLMNENCDSVHSFGNRLHRFYKLFKPPKTLNRLEYRNIGEIEEDILNRKLHGFLKLSGYQIRSMRSYAVPIWYQKMPIDYGMLSPRTKAYIEENGLPRFSEKTMVCGTYTISSQLVHSLYLRALIKDFGFRITDIELIVEYRMERISPYRSFFDRLGALREQAKCDKNLIAANRIKSAMLSVYGLWCHSYCLSVCIIPRCSSFFFKKKNFQEL